MSSESVGLPVIAGQLDRYFGQVEQLLLRRQNPDTGLFPASTAITVHGDYTDAWVRDNVYSIQAVWGLALAYRKAGVDNARGVRLEQAVVNLMRGLLSAMMRQAAKVERFKQSQAPLDALHAKYATGTGDVVVADDKWGHLQLDATSLYLLMLAQMTRAELRIVRDLDEVAFVQNLVYYIGRAYRTPDYGIWERGNKQNNGRPELNASSVGMAKAALEAMQGLNVFGANADIRATIQVMADEIARSRTVLQALLPRESLSKEVDAALLSIIGYPAFAVDDAALARHTREQVVAKLAGPYGLKRFLLDGHQTAIEDHSRLHYEDDELKKFANIESEWPLFYCYLLLDALFRADHEQASEYRTKLQALTIRNDGYDLLPELYYVPAEAIAAERENPGSQKRQPNPNLPLVWAQSLFLLGELIADGLLACADIDPLLRHRERPKTLPTVRLVLIAENAQIKARLAAAGIPAQTMEDVPDVRIMEAAALSRVLQEVGRNAALGLSGWPFRRLRSLATAQGYRIDGCLYWFLASFQQADNFYLAWDARVLLSQLRTELSYLARNWAQPGSPALLFKVPVSALEGATADADAVFDVLRMLQNGQDGDIAVTLTSLTQLRVESVPVELFIPGELFLPTPTQLAHCQQVPEHRDYLPFDPDSSRQPLPDSVPENLPASDLLQQLQSIRSLPQQLRIVQHLAIHHGLDADSGFGAGESVPVRQLLAELYRKAVGVGHWAALRLAAALLDEVYDGLEAAITELLIRQRQIVLGRAATELSVVATPLSNVQLQELLGEHCSRDKREYPLIQELLTYLAIQMRAEPGLLHGMRTIRVSELLDLLIEQLAIEQALSLTAAFERLCAEAPHRLFERLRYLLLQPSLRNLPGNAVADTSIADQCDWRRWRQRAGAVADYPDGFHAGIWQLLHHCDGIVISRQHGVVIQLDSYGLLAATTAGELTFVWHVERLLDGVSAPTHRQLVVEVLHALSLYFQHHPSVKVIGMVELDQLLVNVDVRARLLRPLQSPNAGSADRNSPADQWQLIASLPPHELAGAIIATLTQLPMTSSNQVGTGGRNE